MSPEPAPRWTAADVPDQRGRTVVITGANTGIGFETARILAERAATVILACRDTRKAHDAAMRIRAAAPRATVEVERLDLASLSSVRDAAARIRAGYPPLDRLINNAGVMMPPYARTDDGFELTFGTNHLGHFALTGLLLDRLLAAPGSRIVTVSSIGHRRGHIAFDDLQAARGYRPGPAYFQSKLANLMFTYELQRRLADASAPTIALAAHPGNAYTELPRNMSRTARAVASPRLRPVNAWLLQSAEMGALATARAAVDPAARGGDYYGPPGRFQFTGFPERVSSNARSHDVDAQRRLWAESERLTGVTYRMSASEAGTGAAAGERGALETDRPVGGPDPFGSGA